MTLIAKIESLLFVATAPLSVRQISKILGAKEEEITAALAELDATYASPESGFTIIRRDKEVLLGTKREAGAFLHDYLKEQVRGELTRPQLETLTIIAYRSPVTKTELELIRGVNCSLIVRNLLMRGLIEEHQDGALHVQVYRPSFEFLRFLGVNAVSELPQYEELHKHPDIEAVLEDTSTR